MVVAVGRWHTARTMKGLVTLAALVAAAILPATAAAQTVAYEVPDRDCQEVSPAARMVDNERVRVCQSEWNVTAAWFLGHRARPLAAAEVGLRVELPAEERTFSAACCHEPFGDAVLEPAASGNPSTGVSRYAAGEFFDVTETVRAATGASGYTLTYQLTNRSGAPLKLRPRADLSHYGAAQPHVTTTESPYSIMIESPTAGGSVRLRGSTEAGSPLASGWGFGPDYVALSWGETTLAPAATAVYSVAVDLTAPREVQLSYPSQPPVSPVRMDAQVFDERVRAGSRLRWVLGESRGAVALAADGSGQLVLPVADGPSALTAWFDADDDGVADPDEPSTWADFDWRAMPQPPVTFFPVEVPPPPVVAPPMPPANPTITVPFRATYKVKGCAGRTVQLRLKDGAKVLARRSAKLDRRCRVRTSFRITMRQFTGAKLRVELRFRGRAKTFKLPT